MHVELVSLRRVRSDHLQVVAQCEQVAEHRLGLHRVNAHHALLQFGRPRGGGRDQGLLAAQDLDPNRGGQLEG